MSNVGNHGQLERVQVSNSIFNPSSEAPRRIRPFRDNTQSYCTFDPTALRCSRPFKDNTQPYSYFSEDEFERIERIEKERYERKMIRKYLKQKSKDESTIIV